MNLYVIDPDYPNQPDRRNWPALLGEEVVPTPGMPKHVEPPGIVFIHAQFPVDDLLAFADTNNDSVIVVISGGGKDQDWHDGEQKYWRENPVGKPNDEDFAQSAKRFLKEFKRSGKAEFSFLEPRDNELLLALRLLCEAWLLKNWLPNITHPQLQTLRERLQIQGDKPQLPEGINLMPPSKRDDWLKPFQEEGDTADPLPAILNGMRTDAIKRLAGDFFSKLTGGQVEFKDVADLFLEIDAVVKKSA